MSAYTPRTGAKCGCKRGVQRDNCPTCEGTGWVIDFAAIHAARKARETHEHKWEQMSDFRPFCACGAIKEAN